MKNLRHLSVALVFTLALTLPAFAGEMDTGRTSPPPSQPAQTAAVNGQIDTGLTAQEETDSSEATAADSAADLALNLLQSVLALF